MLAITSARVKVKLRRFAARRWHNLEHGCTESSRRSLDADACGLAGNSPRTVPAAARDPVLRSRDLRHLRLSRAADRAADARFPVRLAHHREAPARSRRA